MTDSLGESGDSPERHSRSSIKVGEATYVFDTNFGEFKGLEHRAPDYYRRMANISAVYFDLVRRGLGIVPEQRATDAHGRDISDLLAFYRREELQAEDLHNVFNSLEQCFPLAFSTDPRRLSEPSPQLAQPEVVILVDAALQETGLGAKLEELGLA